IIDKCDEVWERIYQNCIDNSIVNEISNKFFSTIKNAYKKNIITLKNIQLYDTEFKLLSDNDMILIPMNIESTNSDDDDSDEEDDLKFNYYDVKFIKYKLSKLNVIKDPKEKLDLIKDIKKLIKIIKINTKYFSNEIDSRSFLYILQKFNDKLSVKQMFALMLMIDINQIDNEYFKIDDEHEKESFINYED